MGIKKEKKKVEHCTEKDIDYSLYLWPSYLFPDLDSPDLPEADVFKNMDLELVGIEYDPRDIIMDLKGCYLEVEPLLHTSPQIFTANDWDGVAKVSAKKRGFKVVMALELKFHTIAWLSADNNCHIYWFSREDMDMARPGRVPDIMLDYWGWCRYVVKWLKDQDSNPRLDKQEFLAISKKLNKKRGADSFLLITTKELVLRYLSVHRKLLWTTSSRVKRLVERYNRLSIRSYKTDEDVMRDAPHVFDLAELAPAVLLFGHLGPLIVGGKDQWNELYEAEAEAGTTNEMRERYRLKLPDSISEIQRLMFKPAFDLTADERALLIAEYKDDMNPIPRSTRGSTLAAHPPRLPLPEAMEIDEDEDEDGVMEETFMGPLPLLTDSDSDGEEEEEDSDTEEEDEGGISALQNEVDPTLEVEEGVDDGEWKDEAHTLIRDPVRAKCKTRLCKSVDGFAWTVLKPPKSTTCENETHRPPDALVFKQLSDEFREKKTLKVIKETTKLYTVGPLDFCGHARAIRIGQGCLWDDEQIKEYTAWKTIGTWKKGIQKLSKKALGTELRLRAKVRKELKACWSLDRKMRESDVGLEVRRQKKGKREKQKKRQLKAAAMAAAKAAKKTKGKGAKGSQLVGEAEAIMVVQADEGLFKSARLNARTGDSTAREALRSQASILLGHKKRSKETKVQ
ncbi:hypothetical protein FB451DRAFT_1416394 [Mycena latifolia]|nr:hypothetical protein FB451DRAFT_1416394 [Mycena latifolia]